jgi:hypothetical protein
MFSCLIMDRHEGRVSCPLTKIEDESAPVMISNCVGMCLETCWFCHPYCLSGVSCLSHSDCAANHTFLLSHCRNNPKLLQQAQGIEVGPLFGDLAIYAVKEIAAGK